MGYTGTITFSKKGILGIFPDKNTGKESCNIQLNLRFLIISTIQMEMFYIQTIDFSIKVNLTTPPNDNKYFRSF